MGKKFEPLHEHNTPKKPSTLFNIFHTLLHSIAILFLIYYRASFLLKPPTPFFPWLLVFASELLLSFLWLLGRPFQMKPIFRRVFPERLPPGEELPAIDVFICTADPEKEPTVDVMNTVLSAMALDYPANKLHVYLSDDGGAEVTLHGMREAWKFGRYWIPFRRKFGIEYSCPEDYFSSSEVGDDHELSAERKMIQRKYEEFKEHILQFKEDARLEGTAKFTSRDHPARVEIVRETSEEKIQTEELPLLVYVSREKRPSQSHNFKAGALNVLLRLSGVISNSPFILVLDCDMHCNDPTSAKQAMCLHLDSNTSSSLAFVQFPQRFYGISKHDIYGSRLTSVYEVTFPGLDWLNMGPLLSGSCFYMKREPLYGDFTLQGNELQELRNVYGSSNEFIKSVKNFKTDCSSLYTLPQEAHILAACDYENQTKWGEEVGFLYLSVVEDVFTGYRLHCKGWKSAYLNPPRPQFLGSCISSLNDQLSQGTRWSSGLVLIGLSRFCPLTYGIFRMPFFHAVVYTEFFFHPLCYAITLWCYGTIPQLCLLYGVPLYPQVTSSYFITFVFLFIWGQLKQVIDVLQTGGSIQTWWYEQRLWMMKSVSNHIYGSLDAIMKRLGVRQASFLSTNKVEDDEKIKYYHMGVFDFQTSPLLIAPMVMIVMLNMLAMIVGVIRVVFCGEKELLGQIFLSLYVLATNYAIIEGMILRKDKGRIMLLVSVFSAGLLSVFLLLGSLIVL